MNRKIRFQYGKNDIFWHEWQLSPHSTAYNRSLTFDLRGQLDSTRLLEAISNLISTHEIFKAYFSEKNGELQINLSQEITESIEWIDISTQENIERETASHVDQVKNHIFNLEKAPLFKTKLIKLTENHHILALCFHHIIVDGLSEKFIIEHISAYYNQQPLPPSLSLRAYADIKKNTNSAHNKDESSLYWQKICMQIQANSNDLSPIKNHKEAKEKKGKFSSFSFDHTLLEKINTLNISNKSTWFSFLMTAYLVTLHRLTDSKQLTVCYAVNTRNKKFNTSIGCFTNVLPMATSLKKDTTFSELLAETTKLRAEQKIHQEYPFIEITNKLRQILRSPIGSLLNIALIQTDVKTSKLSLQGIHDTPLIETENEPVYDLLLEYQFTNKGLEFRLNYCNNIFDQNIVADFQKYFRKVVDLFITSPESRINDFSLLDNKEKKKILFDWNRTESDLPAEKLITHAISNQATKNPKNTAIIFEDQLITYQELEEKTNQLAAHLHNHKNPRIKKTQVVPIMLDRGVDRIIAMIAVLKSGQAYTPLDPQSPEKYIASIFKDCKPEQIILSTQYKEKIDKAILSTDLKHIKRTIVDQNSVSVISDSQAALPHITDKDLAYIIYTSGSTGKPKGVKVSHLSLFNLLSSMKKLLKAKANDNFINITQYFFDISALEIYLPFLTGAYCLVPNEEALKSGKILSELVDNNSIRFVQTTPTNWQLLIDTDWNTNHEITIISGGEILPKKLGEDLLSKGEFVWNLYGPTEATIWATAYPVLAENIHMLNNIPIGKPIDNTQVYVLDKYLQPTPIGRIGELYISGLCVADGYLGNAALTREKFIRNPNTLFSKETTKPKQIPEKNNVMYKTGDFVKWEADGNLTFIGRKDLQVKHHGHRIELAEIEAALLKNTHIKQSIVLRQKIHTAGEEKYYLIAYYTLKNTKKSLPEKELRHFLFQNFPAYSIPHKFILLSNMPLTQNGKVDRKSLVFTKISNNQDLKLNLTNTEIAVCKIWEDQLRVQYLHEKDDFYQLGGDSLSAIKIAYHIENQFHVPCSAQTVFNYPTIADLAFYIDSNFKEHDDRRIKQKERTLPLPASSAQKRFWFLSQAHAANRSSYNVIVLWRITGKLSRFHLEKSINQAIQRHEVLRTTYLFSSGFLSQRIGQDYNFNLFVEPLSEAHLSDIVAYEETYSFDFEKQLPYRIRLLELNKNEAILLFNIHHIAIDNRSIYILMREISIFYNKFLENESNFALPELRLQYADFSYSESQKILENYFSKSVIYWKNRLEGYQDLELPVLKDKPTKSIQTGNSYYFSIEAHNLEKLKIFCKDNKITLFTLLLSIYYILLSRYTRQNDIVIGAPVDQRASSALENVLGCFVNTLPLRADLSGNDVFAKFLKKVQKNCLADFNHQDIPFDYLVEQLRAKRTEYESPLVKTAFSVTYENELPTLDLNHLSVVPMSMPVTKSKFDLSLNFFETSSTLNGVIEYDSDMYDGTNIHRMSQHFLNLLTFFTENPEAPIKKVSLLSSAEKRKILLNWNSTQINFANKKTIPELFEEQVARNPSAIAIVEKERRISYLELHKRSSRLASLLVDNGIKTNTLVPIFAERSIELIIAQLAVLKAGATFIPLSPQTPPERLRFILEETNAHIWLTKEKFHNHLQENIGAIKTGIAANLLCIDSIGISIYKELNQFCKVSPENLAYAIYTSGSTGKPKLVGVKHKALSNLIFWHVNEYNVTSNDKAFIASSESFDALIWCIYPYLASGASLHIAETDTTLDFDKWSSWVLEQKISIGFLPTPLINQFLTANKDFPPCDLRFLLTGGDQLTLFPNKKYPFKIVNHYGLTETCIVATKYQLESKRNPSYLRPPIGKPIANYAAYILDENLNPVPINIPGELYIGGIGAETCYLYNSSLNQEKYIKNPFTLNSRSKAKLYRTGDLACWLSDGNIKFIGRLDNQVKIRGFRIELGEIENNLLLHPNIEEAVVVMKSLPVTGEFLVAYIKLAQNISIPNATLINFLAQKLPDYMVPRQFISLKEFPMTANGKIDRKSLRKIPAQPDTFVNSELFTPIEDGTCFSVLMDILQEVLEIPSIDPYANFFDFGVHSLMLVQIIEKINQKIKVKLNISDFFENTTVSQLSEVMRDRHPQSILKTKKAKIKNPLDTEATIKGNSQDIAIIAASCQFPGSNNLEEFWQHLCQGDETIAHFSDQQLKDAGVSETLLKDTRYIKARGIIKDADCFDASFFNIAPREAVLMDPQQRLFLQQAWSALESAGYCSQKYPGSIGIFAGADESHYFNQVLKCTSGSLHDTEDFQAFIAHASQAFLSTKTSYKLGLTGPSLNINTACSTGLVVVDTACQYLRNHRCDIAVAGAVSVKLPQIAGYTYQPESIFSPDGHCRAFDKSAAGTVPSGGVGVVILKRLNEALLDGDSILAVIKGTYINNDGHQKAGFTAPSTAGQANCISQALQSANVSPETIGYIEAHGTGTALGDPIEIKALSTVFSEKTDIKNFCPIGSIKTNIGHADAAAGIAGLIKTTLMLKNQQIPASLHYRKSNKNISFHETPFYVNTKLTNWSKPQTHPRRAGVSAFGIGGTNAHAILEEAPELLITNFQEAKEYQIVILSAKTKPALDQMKVQLLHYLKSQKNSQHDNIADIAFTLQVGRQDFNERYAFICKNRKEAIVKLKNNQGTFASLNKYNDIAANQKIIFLFPGQGVQYAQMGINLYENEPIFKQAVNQCCELLKPHLGLDLKSVLFPEAYQMDSANHLLQQTKLTQPALFCIEYALVKLYNAWGIFPDALMGHSLGEIIAAHFSGIFTLEDALKLVCIRGKLINRLDKGAMLIVQAPAEQVLPLLSDEISIASINSPNSCTISGDHFALSKFKNILLEKSVIFHPIQTSYAFHSSMVEAIVSEFVSEVKKLTLLKPKIPVMSNLTGRWATENQLTDPNYWGQQLRQTVQFSEGIKTVYKTLENPLFIECGPGAVLTSWIKQHKYVEHQHKTICSMLSGNKYQESTDKGHQTIHSALTNLWLYGANINWEAYQNNMPHRRLPLPTYPFEKKRYWPNTEKTQLAPTPIINQGENISQNFYQPSWCRLGLIKSFQSNISYCDKTVWIIFARDDALSKNLIKKLQDLEYHVICVYQGHDFKHTGKNEYTINPEQLETYQILFKSLENTTGAAYQIIHLWCTNNKIGTPRSITKILAQGLYSLTFFAKSSQALNTNNPINILFISDHLHSVFADEAVSPAKATALGACQVIPLEYNNISIATLDVNYRNTRSPNSTLINCIVAEALEVSRNPEVKHFAYRNGYRWERSFQSLELPTITAEAKKIPFRNDGAYLISGGQGGIGLSIAEQLAAISSAHIALVSRTSIPQPQEWKKWLNDNATDHPQYSTIQKLYQLQNKGASISAWTADVGSYAQMKQVVNSINDEFGTIHGVIHAAGIVGSGLIQNKNVNDLNKVLHPKLFGAYVLSKIFKAKPLEFVVFFSSITSITGGVGQLDYSAANASLDAFPSSNSFHPDTFVTTINWNAWLEVGMHAKAMKLSKNLATNLHELNIQNTITPEQGFSCLSSSLKEKMVNLAISRTPPNELAKHTRMRSLTSILQNNATLTTDKTPEEKTTLEIKIASLFKNILGVDSIHTDDDFFALGGDSLNALSLIEAVDKQYKVRLSLNQIFHTKTPNQLAKFIQQCSNKIADSPLVLLNSKGELPPLFMIHPVGGAIFCYLPLAKQLENHQQFYAIQDPGLLQPTYEFNTLESMAKYYLTEIRKIQPHGPYHIGGYSMGGTIAFEIARQLMKMGEKINFLALIDSWAIFADQFRDKYFFEGKMRTHLEGMEAKLKSSMSSNTENWLDCQWKRMQLLLKYQPKALDCKITLFKAQKLLTEYIRIDDAFNHWQQYSKIPMDCFYTPGDHDTLMLPPNIKTLSASFLKCLSQIKKI